MINTFGPWHVRAARVLLVCVLPFFLSYHLGRKIERWEHQCSPPVADPPVPAVSRTRPPPSDVAIQQRTPVAEPSPVVGVPDSSLSASDFIKDRIIWSTAPSEVLLVSFTPETVSFTVSGGYITLHRDTGKVDIPPSLQLDEAARQFWSAVEKVFPRKPKP